MEGPNPLYQKSAGRDLIMEENYVPPTVKLYISCTRTGERS
jgi:hypothetical protein